MIITKNELFELCFDLRDAIDSLYFFVKDNDKITDEMHARAAADLDNIAQGCDVDLDTLESDSVNFELAAWDVLVDNHLILARDRRGKDACRYLHALQKQNARLSNIEAIAID